MKLFLLPPSLSVSKVRDTLNLEDDPGLPRGSLGLGKGHIPRYFDMRIGRFNLYQTTLLAAILFANNGQPNMQINFPSPPDLIFFFIHDLIMVEFGLGGVKQIKGGPIPKNAIDH
jgi:hypothetical protein